MIKIANQPIFNYLRYPGSSKDVLVDMVGENLHSYLEPMRGVGIKPTFITKAFEQYMRRSTKAFTPIMQDVVEEADGACGVYVTHEYNNVPIEKGSCSLSGVWSIREKLLTVLLFGNVLGKSCCFGSIQQQVNKNNEVEYALYVSPKIGYEDFFREVLQQMAWGVVIYLCLFKFADIEVKNLKHGKVLKTLEDKETIEYTPVGNTDFEIMDCKWFREICCDHDFAVRGHFKLQPYKDIFGEWQKKLIYVSDYVKHGYHRKATYTKLQEQ